jgi:hypothetical protein
MMEILRRQNQRTFLAKFLTALLLGVSAGICQKALVVESRMIITQLGMHNRREEGRSAWEALYDTTPVAKVALQPEIHAYMRKSCLYIFKKNQ